MIRSIMSKGIPPTTLTAVKGWQTIVKQIQNLFSKPDQQTTQPEIPAEISPKVLLNMLRSLSRLKFKFNFFWQKKI